MRVQIVVVALLGVALLGVVSDTSRAYAAGTCQNLATSFDGMWSYKSTNITYVEGLAANIRIEHADVCSGSANRGNSSSAWVMVGEAPEHANAVHRSTFGMAQVGFIQNPSYSVNPIYFHEDGATDDDSDFHEWHPLVVRTPQETHRFAVLWGAGCLCLEEWVDSTVIHSATWGDPYTYWGTPSDTNHWVVSLMGETHYLESEIPGSSPGAATVYSNPQAQSATTDQLNPMVCAIHGRNDWPTRYGINGSDYLGCQPWSIFTK